MEVRSISHRGKSHKDMEKRQIWQHMGILWALERRMGRKETVKYPCFNTKPTQSNLEVEAVWNCILLGLLVNLLEQLGGISTQQLQQLPWEMLVGKGSLPGGNELPWFPCEAQQLWKVPQSTGLHHWHHQEILELPWDRMEQHRAKFFLCISDFWSCADSLSLPACACCLCKQPRPQTSDPKCWKRRKFCQRNPRNKSKPVFFLPEMWQ